MSVLSAWLARHAGDEELRRALDELPDDELAPDQIEAVEELRAELADGATRGGLEMVVRETLEAIALGG